LLIECCAIPGVPLPITFHRNHQHVAWWLSNMGLTSVQTLSNDLTISIDASYCGTGACNEAFLWAISIFPQLEVVRGTLRFRLWTASRLTFGLLPGSGLAKLRATGRTAFTSVFGGWSNADLSFLSSLVCPGTQIDGNALSTLGSLTGLDRVVDGNPALENQSCFFSFNNSQSNLSNVSAIAPFAGCGGRQRSDNSTFLPCLKVLCGQINTWTGLCNYVAPGNKCSPPSSPSVPRPPPSPPRPPASPPAKPTSTQATSATPPAAPPRCVLSRGSAFLAMTCICGSCGVSVFLIACEAVSESLQLLAERNCYFTQVPAPPNGPPPPRGVAHARVPQHGSACPLPAR
jgi:hypothetical protein